MPTIALSAPQGAGKTRIAGELARRLELTKVIDEWDGRAKLGDGVLALTNLRPEEYRVDAGVRVIDMDQAREIL